MSSSAQSTFEYSNVHIFDKLVIESGLGLELRPLPQDQDQDLDIWVSRPRSRPLKTVLKCSRPKILDLRSQDWFHVSR